MIRPVTIYLGTKSSVVSRSDGETFELSPKAAEHLRAEAIRLTEDHDGWGYSVPSAATRSGLGEARMVSPIETPWVPRPLELHDGRRVRVADNARVPSKTLARLLGERRTERSLGRLRLSELGSLLVRTGRLMAWRSGSDSVEERHKPVPSAGARHPNELYVLASTVDGLESGWWFFDSASCDLVEQLESFDQESVWAEICEAASLNEKPGAVVVPVARFDRTLSRYPAGSSLVWRDAGALLATLHLCAFDVGLESCIVGLAGAILFDEDYAIADVGALAIGHKR